MNNTALHMAGAFILMGAWAFFANRMHPSPAPMMAGLTQGALSAILTAGLKTLVSRLSSLLSHWILPPIIALAASATLLIAVHLIAATPELLATIAVPLLVSGSYVFIYSYLINRGRP